VFYLDGIEVPVINHFATQGSAGGPTGILNVSFIQDVKLSSSAFEARYDNALSSVFQRNQDNTAFVTTNGATAKADGSNSIPVLLKKQRCEHNTNTWNYHRVLALPVFFVPVK
jgi:hypothetical protein